MTRDEQIELLELTRENNEYLKANNFMLKQIVAYLAREAAYAEQENKNDFVRNVFANLVSNALDVNMHNFNNKII